MEALDYMRAYLGAQKASGASPPVRINLITNFTDDVLMRVLGGVCVVADFNPTITRVPYKQHHIALKDPQASVYISQPDISFIFFDSSMSSINLPISKSPRGKG